MSKAALRIVLFWKVILNATVQSFPTFLQPSRKPLSLESATSSIITQEDVDVILRSRRTISSFEPTLPDGWEEKLEAAIESAIHAPNHKRTEPWRFHLLGKETSRKICELNAEIVTKSKGEKAGQRKLERWLTMPGWLVVTCMKSENDDGTSDSMEKPTSLAREDYAAVCCAIQNLSLSLHAAGLGTKWTTGKVNFDKRFDEIVGLSPNEYVVGTIWFGTPAKNPKTVERKRKDVLIRHD